jgi:hypothetical protein
MPAIFSCNAFITKDGPSTNLPPLGVAFPLAAGFTAWPRRETGGSLVCMKPDPEFPRYVGARGREQEPEEDPASRTSAATRVNKSDSRGPELRPS